jgi:hypothetical protein
VNPARRAIRAAARHAAALPARARHGRPLRITARAAIATTTAILTAATIPGTPAEPAICAGAALWWTLTLPPDLTPPPGPSQEQP